MQHSGSTDCSALLCMDTLSEACGGENMPYVHVYSKQYASVLVVRLRTGVPVLQVLTTSVGKGIFMTP